MRVATNHLCTPRRHQVVRANAQQQRQHHRSKHQHSNTIQHHRRRQQQQEKNLRATAAEHYQGGRPTRASHIEVASWSAHKHPHSNHPPTRRLPLMHTARTRLPGQSMPRHAQAVHRLSKHARGDPAPSPTQQLPDRNTCGPHKRGQRATGDQRPAKRRSRQRIPPARPPPPPPPAH